MNHRIIVRVLVRNKEGGYLVIFLPSKHTSTGLLAELPGGEVELFDTPMDRARKEVEEEVGICIGDPKYVMMIGYDYKNHPVRAAGWLFVAQAEDGYDIKIGDDTIAEYRWLKYEDLANTIQTFPIPNEEEIISALNKTN